LALKLRRPSAEDLSMIRGIHGLFYSSTPEDTRAFFRDKVRFPGADVGEGWWIFDVPEGDFGVHPVEDATDAGTEDHGYGLVTYFTAPGGLTVQLYEPRYSKAPARKPKAPSRRAAPKKPGPRRATKSGGKSRRK
jgi:hypothetical protein